MSKDFNYLREQMVLTQIEHRGVANNRVLDAMRSVPRHKFVSVEYIDDAYADFPLPIGYGQTISQPFIVALMTSLLDLKGAEKVLEVGTGSGYQAAILSGLTTEVHTVELVAPLAQQARLLLKELQYNNVRVHTGDGSLGWLEDAPYDAVIVTAAAPEVPASLFIQLKRDGRLVIPVGRRGSQSLELWTNENGNWIPEQILPVAFVPLRGEFGWKTEE